MSVEQTVKEVFQEVLDIKAEEIKLDQKLDTSLGIDSTEMVEINVALKKRFNLDMQNNELKKTHSFNEIVQVLKSKGVN